MIFHAVTLGKVINRGFLNGPVCPVYGFGVLSVFAVVNTIQRNGYEMNDGMIFLFGIVLATVVEWVAGWILDKCFHVRLWDYSNKPLNFHGYICMEFSLIWGLAIVFVVNIFQTYVEKNTSSHADSNLGWIIAAILYGVYFSDFIVTVAVMHGLNKKLTKLDRIRSDMRIVSDKISDSLAMTTIDTAQIVGEGKVQVALAKAELHEVTEVQKDKSLEKFRKKRDELQEEFNELENSIIKHTIIGPGRIIRAFPDMKHRDYHEVVQELKNKLSASRYSEE